MPRNATRDNCDNRPYNQQRECRPDELQHEFSTALESHQIQEKLYKVAPLSGVEPGRVIMLSTALYQLVLSLSRLAGAMCAIALFSRILSIFLDTGLYCEADGHYDYIPTLHDAKPDVVTKDMATKGMGEVGGLLSRAPSGVK